ncbi:hypothetical protein ACYSNM_09510 [Myroides sp. LJL116]
MANTKVECSKHGTKGIGLLCTHLAHSLFDPSPLGFFEHDQGDTARADAWCQKCEDRWALAQNEEQREQWFLDCDFKLLCESCWDQAKEINL